MNSPFGSERQPAPSLTVEDRWTLSEAAARNRGARQLGMSPIAYDASRLPRPEHTAVEIKANGIGLLAVPSMGKLCTLEGVPFRAATHLNAGFDLLERAFGQEMFYQCEYVEAGGFEATLAAFRSGTGAGAALILDALPIPAWLGDEPSVDLHSRRRLMDEAWDLTRPNGIGLIPHAQGFDQEGVELAAGIAWDDGHEGIVVKDLTSPFVRAKSSHWMKVKRIESVDVPIQSVRVTAGRLVAIVVTYLGRPIVVPVGFSEAQRAHPEEFVPGRMVEIKHNGETARGALQGATFLRFRDDKVR